MKYLLTIGIVLLSMSACKKQNPLGEIPENQNPMDILMSHDWRWGGQFQVRYYGQNSDTTDNLQYMDSCLRNATMHVGEEVSLLQNGYQWLYTDPCTGKTEEMQVFAIDTVQDKPVVQWGYYTMTYQIDRLDDIHFSFYYPSIGQIGDSMRYYYVFVK